MDDMNAFEQQVANEVVGSVRAPRSVDVTPIVRAASSDASRKGIQSLFGVTRFALVGVIVALLGGILLAGMLTRPDQEPLPAADASATTQAEPTEATAQPEPTPDSEETTRSDILPGAGLVVEEVEPGVYRVISDGVRDIAQPPTGWGSYDDLGNELVAGLDGSVWNFVIRGTWNGADESAGAEPADCGYCVRDSYRLGDAGNHEWTGELASVSQVAVGPDGTVWAIVHSDEPAASGLRSFDGDAWTSHDLEDPDQIEVLADGSVWVASALYPSEEPRLDRLGPDGWETVPVPVAFEHMVANASGSVLYLLDEDSVWGQAPNGEWTRLTRLEDIDAEPRVIDSSGPRVVEPSGQVRAGADGTVWTTVSVEGTGVVRGLRTRTLLARFDGSSWATFQWPAGLDTASPRDVAPDGAVWMAGDYDGSCQQGVIRSDGTTWSQYLDGSCVTSFDISPNGSAWLQAWSQEGGNNTYVITPEALGTTE